MGVRSSNHQLVGGKQYFGSDVQFNGALQAVKKEVITATDGLSLTADQSGAIVVVGDDIDVNLPTPAVGLNFKFVANAAISANLSKIISTTNGTTAVDLFFGCININGTPTIVSDKSHVQFANPADEGDWIEVTCVGTSVTDNAQTWHVCGAGAASGAFTFAST